MQTAIRSLFPVESAIIRAAELVRKEMEDMVFLLPPSDFNSMNLMGACGISSWALRRVLRKQRIDADFVMGSFDSKYRHRDTNDTHCWVESRGCIIDVTATQFKIKSPVFVTPVGDRRYQRRAANSDATRRLEGWGGQSHEWHRSKLEEMIRRVNITMTQELAVAA